MRAVEDDHWWYRALRGQVVNCLSSLPPDFHLLDAGCGSGGMLARVRERFPHATLTGLDLNQRALELTEARQTHTRLFQGTVDRLPFADASFNAVLSLDVIYHRDVDDAAALREMRRVLQTGGALFLNVPAFDFLRGSHDIAINTARRYTRPQLVNLLTQAGFMIETITYWNMLLLPAIALVRRLSRARTTGMQSDLASPPPRWVNPILHLVSRSELSLGRKLPLPFGTSLFAVARK